MAEHDRPLSPFLIYRPQLTSVLSITHRISGALLGVGALILVYWLGAASSGLEAYSSAQAFFGSWVGLLLLLSCSTAYFYHLCNGIRHLFWDVGMGFELSQAYASGWVVVVAAVLLTALYWFGVIMVYGGGS